MPKLYADEQTRPWTTRHVGVCCENQSNEMVSKLNQDGLRPLNAEKFDHQPLHTDLHGLLPLLAFVMLLSHWRPAPTRLDIDGRNK